MKTINLKGYTLLIGIFIISITNSCTTSKLQNIPTPPHNIATKDSISITNNFSTIPMQKQIESSTNTSQVNQNNLYIPITTIKEQRMNGGFVTQIKIDNRGKIPDYYIYPTGQQNLNINNPQRNMATPTWQLSW
jgi:hypothetical protein